MTSIQSGFASVNGAQIYYEIAGTGHPLVFVHAGIADCRMWEDQFEAFAEQYRVVRYDMRGYGRTAPVDGEFAHYQDLYGLLTFLNIDHAYLMGCSKGGGVILDFALAYPQMAAALIPVCSNPNGYEFTGDPPKLWDEAVAAYKRGDLERTAELEVQLWVDGPHRTPDQVDARIRELVREMDLIALSSEVRKLGSEQVLKPVASGRLAEIHCPALILVGDLDDPELIRAGDVMAAGIAGAQKAVISGTAHLPNMERPAEFNRLVLDFLRRI